MNLSTLARHSTEAESSNMALDDALRRIRVLEESLANLRAAVSVLESLERHRDTLLSRFGEVQAPALSSSCHVSAREFIEYGIGFHGLEYGGQNAAYRWTGPSHESRLMFWLDRRAPIEVRIGISSFGATPKDSPVSVEVDGVAYAATFDPDAECLVAGPVPPAQHVGPTEVVIHSPRMFSPSNGGEGDTRILGLAINRIEVAPV
jgi:hypothetical protein